MSKPSLPIPTPIQVSNSGDQNGEKKTGYLSYELEHGFTVQIRRDLDLTMDPKKLKRIISNRVSAQRSRWKKQQYVADLEKKAEELQIEVSLNRSKFELLREKYRCQQIEYMELKERVFATDQRLISSQAEYKTLVAALREVGK